MNYNGYTLKTLLFKYCIMKRKFNSDGQQDRGLIFGLQGQDTIDPGVVICTILNMHFVCSVLARIRGAQDELGCC